MQCKYSWRACAGVQPLSLAGLLCTALCGAGCPRAQGGQQGTEELDLEPPWCCRLLAQGVASRRLRELLAGFLLEVVPGNNALKVGWAAPRNPLGLSAACGQGCWVWLGVCVCSVLEEGCRRCLQALGEPPARETPGEKGRGSAPVPKSCSLQRGAGSVLGVLQCPGGWELLPTPSPM